MLNSTVSSPLQVLYVVEEPLGPDALLEGLSQLLADGGQVLSAARARAETQLRNRELLEQQNADYQASLLADQERERLVDQQRQRQSVLEVCE